MEEIDIDELNKQIQDMSDDELYDFFILIHGVENNIIDEFMKNRL